MGGDAVPPTSPFFGNHPCLRSKSPCLRKAGCVDHFAAWADLFVCNGRRLRPLQPSGFFQNHKKLPYKHHVVTMFAAGRLLLLLLLLPLLLVLLLLLPFLLPRKKGPDAVAARQLVSVRVYFPPLSLFWQIYNIGLYIGSER